jgi:folate-dependent phosphoribosylglycinamide formyltransferase PurN
VLTHNSIVYNAYWLRSEPLHEPTGSLRVLFLTSIRDTGKCDRNGLVVETPDGPSYMKGVIETTVVESRPGGRLHGLIEVVGVITDDIAEETGDYPVVPTDDCNWIHPLDLVGHDGVRIADLTINLPSFFRKLPLTDKKGRIQAKKQFERALLLYMQAIRADVLISDHYMARIKHLVSGLGLFGKVLNIHPAITLRDHPYWFPGKTPTADAIAAAGRNGGKTFTGATLHFMDKIIDHGPPIAYQCATPVYASDQPQQLRARNYPVKCEVFVKGMIHYAKNFYPYLDRFNFKNFSNRVRLDNK